MPTELSDRTYPTSPNLTTFTPVIGGRDAIETVATHMLRRGSRKAVHIFFAPGNSSHLAPGVDALLIKLSLLFQDRVRIVRVNDMSSRGLRDQIRSITLKGCDEPNVYAWITPAVCWIETDGLDRVAEAVYEQKDKFAWVHPAIIGMPREYYLHQVMGAAAPTLTERWHCDYIDAYDFERLDPRIALLAHEPLVNALSQNTNQDKFPDSVPDLSALHFGWYVTTPLDHVPHFCAFWNGALAPSLSQSSAQKSAVQDYDHRSEPDLAPLATDLTGSQHGAGRLIYGNAVFACVSSSNTAAEAKKAPPTTDSEPGLLLRKFYASQTPVLVSVATETESLGHERSEPVDPRMLGDLTKQEVHSAVATFSHVSDLPIGSLLFHRPLWDEAKKRRRDDSPESNIVFVIASHRRFLRKTLPVLLPSLIEGNGIDPSRILVVSGGNAKSLLERQTDGVLYSHVTHNSYDHTALIDVLDRGIRSPWFFNLHDTCEAGPEFLNNIVRKGFACAGHIPVLKYGWLNMGLFSEDFLRRQKDYILAMRNSSKMAAILSETVYPRQQYGAADGYSDVPDIVNLPHQDVYRDGKPRLPMYLPKLDLTKYQSYHFESSETHDLVTKNLLTDANLNEASTRWREPRVWEPLTYGMNANETQERGPR